MHDAHLGIRILSFGCRGRETIPCWSGLGLRVWGLEHGNQPLAGPINIMARLVQTLERHSHLKCRVEVQGTRFGICQREITTCRAKENRVSKIIEFWCKDNRVSKRIEFWCLGSRGYIHGRDHDLSDDGEGDRQGDSEALSLEDEKIVAQ